MNDLELVESRHAVRSYLDKAIEPEKKEALNRMCESINKESGLHLQMVYDEPRAFSTLMAHYGRFVNVKNYIAIVGEKGKDEEMGYYGQQLVIEAQRLGLSSCWVAMSYGKSKAEASKAEGEKLRLVISLGYGASQGIPHHDKKRSALVEEDGPIPEGFEDGVKAAMAAPTAVNQQKWKVILHEGKVRIVRNGVGFYADVDLGIVRYNFEFVSHIKTY